MKRAILVTMLALFAVLWARDVSAQGCPVEPVTTVVNPRKVQMSNPEHDRIMLDGEPAVTGYVLGWYAEGALEPTAQAPIAKSAFTLVVGTTTCYEALLPAMGAIPLGQKYFAVLKTVRGTEESPWTAPSNPFGFEGAVLAPGLTRVKK